ncbi:MAG TPA: two-component system response regulator [Nitrospiraceae bacterium]|nr:MAG: two-component system response regulator [Nitrospirae bacterium GWA2_46_11]OGW22975.1 MAG: two-component system response regulator [Nitrospirae bacterium GWB2_47_37]HAK87950.1 two-component system response regulator [Nitrospiraceae bacterium]HCL81163.1 two-component system response regulator [Nitrospiraceae bacterium]
MKILVVDDDKTTRKLLSLYLKGKGYEVVTAENGLDAIEKVGTESVNFILTDMNMPYMDGIEFTKNIKSDPVLKSIPIVMVTTEADEDERERAFKAGVDEYLVKPVNAEQVTEAVVKILKKIFKGGGAGV